MMVALTFCLLGIALGVRHALEPDHLTAVSTLIVEQRGARRAAALGALWGVGHAWALLTVGLVLALLRARMPGWLADLFELGVAVMLVGLGVRALVRAVAQGRSGHPAPHATHPHAGPADHVHVGRWTFARRSLAIGVVHGLAGSGSLTAMVVSSLPSTGARLLYVTLFAMGSIGGMALLSGVAGWPLGRIARHPWAGRTVALTAGLLSIGLGIAWGCPPLWRLASPPPAAAAAMSAPAAR